jgi:hypothetical protein
LDTLRLLVAIQDNGSTEGQGGEGGQGGKRKVEESAAGTGTSNEEQPHFAGAGEGKDSFDHLYPVTYALLQGELRGCRGMEQRGAFLVS